MDETLMEMTIRSHPQLLTVVRCAIKEFSDIVGFSDRDAYLITLAVDEACNNVICHTYENRCDNEMTIICRRFADGLEVTVQDVGPKVDETQLRSRPLDEIRPGGLGLHFMHSIMDQVRYDPDFPEGNRLIMIKKLIPESAVDASSNAEGERA
jgi:anti-sigma regulatory factor (Ser/Thr protein kinase)